MNNRIKYLTSNIIWCGIFFTSLLGMQSCCSTSLIADTDAEVLQEHSAICIYCNGTGQEYFCPHCGITLFQNGKPYGNMSHKFLHYFCNTNTVFISRPCQHCHGIGEQNENLTDK